MPSTESSVARIRVQSSTAGQGLLMAAVESWRSQGARLVGLIEETHGLPGRTCNAGSLRDFVTGVSYSIYLDEPQPGKTCHIDASGAGRACAAVLHQMDKCDLVVLSKFGKLEASGDGLFRAFVAAVDTGTPILTTVSSKHLQAWNAFMPTAAALPAKLEALQDWWTAVRSR